jgi:hypothetical protein
MIMRSILITGIAWVAFVGVANAELRNVSNFTGVSAADRIRVEVGLGEQYRVEVTGSEAGKVTPRVDDGLGGTHLIAV